MKKVLFVCSGNVFRSLIAHECLKDYLKKNQIKGIEVYSAGVNPKKDSSNNLTREDLKEEGIVFRHKPKKVTKRLIEKNDLIISMGKNHQKFLKEKFGVNSVLFNKIAYNNSKSVLDIGEKYPFLLKISKKEIKKQKEYIYHINWTVKYISKGTPKLANKIIKLFFPGN